MTQNLFPSKKMTAQINFSCQKFHVVNSYLGGRHILIHFQSCAFWKCKSQKSKNQKFAQKCQDDPKNHFQDRISENDTFESVKIESARASVQALRFAVITMCCHIE